MNESGFPFGDIIILALIAGFILLRLRSVLGQKMDGDPTIFPPKLDDKNQNPDIKKPDPRKSDPIIQLVEKTLKPRANKPENEHDPVAASLEGSPLAADIAEIKTKDPAFNATTFLNGAKMAFEMVFDAFAKGDKPTLEMLLSKELYDDFIRDIEAREKQETLHDTTLLAVAPKEILSARLNANMARIAVHFESEQVTLERDKSGKIISGDPSDTVHVRDEWVFERDTTSKNPNWKIIET